MIAVAVEALDDTRDEGEIVMLGVQLIEVHDPFVAES